MGSSLRREARFRPSKQKHGGSSECESPLAWTKALGLLPMMEYTKDSSSKETVSSSSVPQREKDNGVKAPRQHLATPERGPRCACGTNGVGGAVRYFHIYTQWHTGTTGLESLFGVLAPFDENPHLSCWNRDETRDY